MTNDKRQTTDGERAGPNTEHRTPNTEVCALLAAEVAGLIARLEDADIRASAAAQEALTAALARLTPESAALLGRRERDALLGVLRASVRWAWPTYRDVPFVEAVARALALTGDRRGRQALEKLIRSSPQPQVRAAAIHALPTLLEQMARAAERETLLRSSSRQSAEAQRLARPVGGMRDDGMTR